MKRRTLLSILLTLPVIALAGPYGSSTSRSRAGGPLDPRRRDDQEETIKQAEPGKQENVQDEGDDRSTQEEESKSKD